MTSHDKKWQSALTRLLRRLAFGEGPGMLVVTGAYGSGKTHLLHLLAQITENTRVAAQFDDETKALADLVCSRQYAVVPVGGVDLVASPSIPVSIIDHLLDTIYTKGMASGRPVLLVCDELEIKLSRSRSNDINHKFLEIMHHPLAFYQHATFVVSVQSTGSQDCRKILGFRCPKEHMIAL